MIGTPIQIKKLYEDAKIPEYKTKDSVGADLYAYEGTLLQPNEPKLIKTGIAIALLPFVEAQIRPRSGLALKHCITVLNSPGTVDSDYRGEIGVILVNLGKKAYMINKYDRIAQLVINDITKAKFIEVKELPDTDRGPGGFGHTGK